MAMFTCIPHIPLPQTPTSAPPNTPLDDTPVVNPTEPRPHFQSLDETPMFVARLKNSDSEHVAESGAIPDPPMEGTGMEKKTRRNPAEWFRKDCEKAWVMDYQVQLAMTAHRSCR